MQGLNRFVFFERKDVSEPHIACFSGVRTEQERKIFLTENREVQEMCHQRSSFPLNLD
jgi:hypothetical protein